MIRKSVVLHPAALAEAEAAVEWLDELDQAIEQISSAPNRFPIYQSGSRRMLLRRVPYLVVFRRRPGYLARSDLIMKTSAN